MDDSTETIERLTIKEEAGDAKGMNKVPVGVTQEGRSTVGGNLRLMKSMEDYILTLEQKVRERGFRERERARSLEEKERCLEERENAIAKWEREVRGRNRLEVEFNNRANEFLNRNKRWENSLETQEQKLRAQENRFERYKCHWERKLWWHSRVLETKEANLINREQNWEARFARDTLDIASKGGQGDGEANVGEESCGGGKRGIGDMVDGGEVAVALAPEGKRPRLSSSL
ncbi:hypothetical protein BGX38DRAFT_1192622 [Terfezia claveryi]|nr:hypothetical protein BGX38DRAFT_1192622 [Terfezia claveryi]